MSVNGVDVLIALCIRAGNRIFRRWNNDLHLRPKLGHQTVYDALSIIRTIREEPAHIGINVSKQIMQCRFIAHMFSNQLLREDIASV